ncbi:hypothetical protein GUK36_12275 [Rhizobium leguminosarum]|uniref:Tyr recombinase domain-containing protein n=1 Tax=Rhizobium leguminosarum TaxID=384 RepID=A0A6P0DED8_RHILE|nr:hypothetical protein [Rhizobium leguminosarum]NEK50202.1 hypothetical protein [Rhizobium leguminosarum]
MALGIKDPSVVFHSFRHTFQRMARHAGLPEKLHDALTGHAEVAGWQELWLLVWLNFSVRRR